MQNVRPLRKALISNAVFSTSCGLFMIFNPAYVNELLGINTPIIPHIAGIALLLFAFDLVHQATRMRPATWRALYSSSADFLWVMGSLAAIAFYADSLPFTGLVVISGVAVIVLFFGIWQVRAINHAHRGYNKDMYRHCIRVKVSARADAMWNVLRRLGDIANYMPSLKSSDILEGKAACVGAVRRCVDSSGRCWSEECVEFNEGRSFVVRFLADEAGFPFPASEMTGGWEVSDAEDGAYVTVWWELKPKPEFLAPLIIPILAYQADRDFPKIITRIAEDVNKSDNKGPGKISARLLPIVC